MRVDSKTDNDTTTGAFSSSSSSSSNRADPDGGWWEHPASPPPTQKDNTGGRSSAASTGSTLSVSEEEEESHDTHRKIQNTTAVKNDYKQGKCSGSSSSLSVGADLKGGLWEHPASPITGKKTALAASKSISTVLTEEDDEIYDACNKQQNNNKRGILPRNKQHNYDEERCIDTSPNHLEEPSKQQHRSRRRLACVALVVVLILFIGIGLGVGLGLGVYGGNSDVTEDTTTSSDGSTTTSPTFCDGQFSKIEEICRMDKDRIFESKDMPKCIQDNFDSIYVRSGRTFDDYTDFRQKSHESLFSCTHEGMALKRLSVMEYNDELQQQDDEESSTTTTVECECAFFTLYYELGEVEWWTEEGTQITNVCSRDGISCKDDGRYVDTFPNHLGEVCHLSDITLV